MQGLKGSFQSPFVNRVLDQCTSTNTLAWQAALAGAPHGTWVSAKQQGQGRGKGQSQWVSLEGNLFLSFVLRIPVSFFPSFCFHTAAWIAHFLRLYALPATIKWPNDVYVGQQKIAGVLCESRIGPHPFLIVGIGLNCRWHPPYATSLTQVCHQRTEAHSIRPALIAFLQKKFTYPPPALSLLQGPVYEWLRPHTPLEWVDAHTHQYHQGHILGLTPAYALWVQKKNDQPTVLTLENAYHIRINPSKCGEFPL